MRTQGGVGGQWRSREGGRGVAPVPLTVLDEGINLEQFEEPKEAEKAKEAEEGEVIGDVH